MAMSKPTPEKPPEPLTAEDVVKALSYHGAFLKKHVLATLRVIPGVRIINEEHASDFGGKTRTSDILAFDDNKIILRDRMQKSESGKVVDLPEGR